MGDVVPFPPIVGCDATERDVDLFETYIMEISRGYYQESMELDLLECIDS